MAIPPLVVATAREGWRWQWRQLMQGLGPADREGRYIRPPSDRLDVVVPINEDLQRRSETMRPRLVIGRSCPWAHRTWLMHRLRRLDGTLSLLMATANHKAGRWSLTPSWLGCDSLLALYRHCDTPPHHRATVPALIDPSNGTNTSATLLSNDSAALTEALNRWPGGEGAEDLAPVTSAAAIAQWQQLLQPAVNDGVYRCGFARTQRAYDEASSALFSALETVEASLQGQGPWLCGEQLTIADVRLFPTLIRWELVYAPLFGCSARPLWMFPALWRWRQRFYALPGVTDTCDGEAWRADYYGALFPLNPSGIVPSGPDLSTLVNNPEALP